MNKNLCLFILFVLFFRVGIFALADEHSSSLDNKPSVDSAAMLSQPVPVVPSDTLADTHTSYLYDLKKLIQKSRENIKQVNDKIKEQAVYKRNQAREERAHEYYEKGMALTNEGKLDEAREYFDKAIRITEHPEMAGYIKESVRRLKRQENALHAQERAHYKQIKNDENARKENVEDAYRQAIDLFKQKKYHPAKDAFEHVDEISPDYRGTSSYLKIIDQNIITEDALAVKKQAVEIARQQKEAEAARAKEKAAWLAQIEEKEKERKGQINKEAEEVYKQAVESYQKKKFALAKKKFEEVSWVLPDYKDTVKYLRRIDKDAQEEQEHVAVDQKKALQDQRWQEEVENKKREVQRQHEQEIKDRQHQKELVEQAQFLYSAAVALYDKKNMDDALVKFNDIEKTCPDYKSTRSYIIRIVKSNPKLKSMAVFPSPLASPHQPVLLSSSAVKGDASLEEQQKEMREIADLARRAADLYSKVADMGNDRSTVQMKRKMAEVDKILKDLKEKKERLLHHMREAIWKRQNEESRAKQEEHKAEIEVLYQEGLKYLRTHDYEKAKIKFVQLEDIAPDYKSTQRYLRRIDDYQKNAALKIAANFGQIKPAYSQNAEQARRLLQQQESLNQLAQKASAINDDIIGLSRSQDYEAMKAKFTELENTITALATLKNTMMQQKDNQKREKQLARDFMQHHNEMLKSQKQEERQIPVNDTQKPLKENRPIASSLPANLDYYKRREITQQQNLLFSEAVDCYKQKKYAQAKLLFVELSGQQDRRADAWLRKVDRAITREILKKHEGEMRERTAYIAEQIKAQRELVIFQERERQRQKKLAEELERQKRLYEDNRSLQIRKEETMKVQERERRLQEEKRLKLEKDSEKQQQLLRFRRIETGGNQPGLIEQHPQLPSTLPGVETLRVQREAIRKQLEDGVEVMYKEALGLFEQGNYTSAADRFKDVQDILPGYKHAGEYMDKARRKSLTVNSELSLNSPATPIADPPSAPVSRQESISKTLDLFDSNVK